MDKKLRNIVLWTCAAWAMSVSAQTERMYRCELGLQGGCGYYVGEATEYVFQDVREAYGLHFRYKLSGGFLFFFVVRHFSFFSLFKSTPPERGFYT